jgi:RNA polymerase-binding transcription factor DksA
LVQLGTKQGREEEMARTYDPAEVRQTLEGMLKDLRGKQERNQQAMRSEGATVDNRAQWDIVPVDEVVFVLTDRNTKEIRDVEAALYRLTVGIYGKCSSCGSDIDLVRLRAMPTTMHCRYCADPSAVSVYLEK